MKTVKNKVNKERFYFFVCIVLFSIFVYGSISFYYKDFIVLASENSLFLPSRSFFLQNMKTAGGLLNYGGLFFTQFFHYPLIGSAILLLLLLFVVFLVIKTFELPSRHYPLAFIPAFALFTSVTETGYLLLTLKSPGYMFSNTLGIILCLLICWGFITVLKKQRYIHYFIPVIIIFTYPFLGFYSFFAVFMCFMTNLFLLRLSIKTSIAQFSVYLLTGLLVPWFFSRFIYTEMPWYETFIAGLPKFHFNLLELPLWITFIILFVSLLLISGALRTGYYRIQEKKTGIYISIGVFILMLAEAYLLSFRNSNFKTELKILHAIEANNWNEAVSIREKYNKKPTRLIVMLNNLALHKLGLAGDRMFATDNNSVLHNFYKKDMIMINYGAKPLYFQYGLVNYCYRWCMEDMVEYGMTVQGLKYMIKCSLINGELSLAKKYNDVLKQTFFHRKFADKYQKYIDNSQLIAEDDEFKAIYPLMAYQNRLDKDPYLLEYYILNHFATMRGGPPELVELSIQSNLIIKNVERFWPRFFLFLSAHDRIPAHYQEAALIYSYLESNVDLSSIKLDEAIVEKFEQLVSMSKEYVNNSDEKNSDIFKPLFGKTFWYYYFFTTNVKTN